MEKQFASMAQVRPTLDRPARWDASVFGVLPDGQSPLYQRVAVQIRAAISAGRIPAGAQIPTEDELALHFGVSLITIRSALKDLQDTGLIERRQGRGTFVRQARARTAEWGLGSVADLVITGRLTTVSVLRCARDPAPAWVREIMEVPPTTRLLHVRITRNQYDKPLMMTDAWFPPAVGKLIQRPDLTSLFAASPLLIEVVERLTGTTVADMRQTMTAGLATEDVAQTINVPAGSPVLIINRVNRTDDGRLLQLAQSYYRTDGVAYSIHLKRG
jgi:GntR family transcriptional regulator